MPFLNFAKDFAPYANFLLDILGWVLPQLLFLAGLILVGYSYQLLLFEDQKVWGSAGGASSKDSHCMGNVTRDLPPTSTRAMC